MSKPVARPVVVSAYSGAGGLDLGFIKAGFSVVWANDFENMAVETYRANIGEHVHGGDINAVPWPAPGSADVVIGGPPCQGFSQAGKMDPADPRSKHVFTFFDLVAHVRPKAFVMENVKSLGVNTRWSAVRQALRARAAALGYTTDLFLLKASDYGVPQARERMFLIGCRDRTPLAPVPTSVGNPPTVRSTLAAIAPYGASGNDGICSAIITPAKSPVLRRSPYAGMLFNGQGRPLDLDAPALTLPATMGGNRTPIIDQEALDKGAAPWVVAYHKRLLAGGPVAAKIPSPLRRLTVQEAAALQTFDPSWQFRGPQVAQFRQIGNAVPPRLAKAVALSVHASLAWLDRASEALPLEAERALARA